MGEEGRKAASFFFFLSSAWQSPFCMLLSAWLLVHSSARRDLFRGLSENRAASGGPAGVPGLEERRAEWLTTFNFCFSVGLGWGIFFFSTSQNFFSPCLRNLFFSFCHFFCRSYQRNQD